jgi:hypothetical protein
MNPYVLRLSYSDYPGRYVEGKERARNLTLACTASQKAWVVEAMRRDCAFLAEEVRACTYMHMCM